MKTLIHICCAPCLIAPLESLRAEGIQASGLFHNPNIHPLLEFRKRIKALRVFLETDPLHAEINETYGLHLFIQQAYDPDQPKRCENCYALRLTHTARRARERGLDSFTTTLLSSPHQDHHLIRRVAERVARQLDLPFLYRDFRPLHQRSHDLARQKHLYRQPYCGCCFSEYERFKNTTRELYKGPGHPE